MGCAKLVHCAQQQDIDSLKMLVEKIIQHYSFCCAHLVIRGKTLVPWKPKHLLCTFTFTSFHLFLKANAPSHPTYHKSNSHTVVWHEGRLVDRYRSADESMLWPHCPLYIVRTGKNVFSVTQQRKKFLHFFQLFSDSPLCDFFFTNS